MTREIIFYLNILKEYGLYIFIFLGLIALTALGIGPQFKNFSANRAQLAKISAKLNNLDSKIKSLEGLNKNALTTDLQKLNQALPSEKDVGAMLGVLDHVAARSGARLGTFSLSVGSLESSTPSAAVTGNIGVPSIKLEVSLRGNLENVRRFVAELGKVLPVMDTSRVSYSGEGTSTITLNFYFKPLGTNISRSIDAPLPSPVNKEKTYTLVAAREALPIVTLEVGTSSATVRKDPFR